MIGLTNNSTFRGWVRATWTGWVLGVPVVVLLALVGETLGIGGSQFLVGAGVGMGVGLLQARELRGAINRPVRWLWSCAAGLSLPFVATDITKAARWDLPYTLYACVAFGGFLAGAWQAILLRPRYQSTGWWIAASTLGWSLASGTAAVADTLQRGNSLPRGIWGALAYLAIIAAGGLGLGLVTAVTLRHMSRHPPKHDRRSVFGNASFGLLLVSLNAIRSLAEGLGANGCFDTPDELLRSSCPRAEMPLTHSDQAWRASQSLWSPDAKKGN